MTGVRLDVQDADAIAASLGEVLVERVRGERWAERDGDFARRFAIFNGA